MELRLTAVTKVFADQFCEEEKKEIFLHGYKNGDTLTVTCEAWSRALE